MKQTFENWLEKRYQPSTIKRYLWEIDRLKKHLPDAQSARQMAILGYLDLYRKLKRSPGYLHAILAVIKVWYDYLQETGQRKDHPCKYLRLKDQGEELQLQELFLPEELEALLERKERYVLMKNRNQVITGLLIYQGLMVGEICKLRPKDINLEEGKINVPATAKTLSRILPMKSKQILPMANYLTADREKLLAGKTAESLIITKKGTEEKGEGICYLLETQRKRFGGRKLTPRAVRMSVIANWLREGIDLRKVQYLAGHKKPSSTERYKQSAVEQLQLWVEKFHPLG